MAFLVLGHNFFTASVFLVGIKLLVLPLYIEEHGIVYYEKKEVLHEIKIS